jgi:Taurine catabolism dioxygenase TauD, TfdA family
MAVFCYAESHHERWTISDSAALERSPDLPELCAFGHLAKLSSEVLGADNLRLRSAWPDPGEPNVDVLVLAEPECPSTKPADDAEMLAILAFVRGGGGLFMMAGAGVVPTETIAARLAESAGIKITSQLLLSPVPGDESLLSDSFACASVAPHPATNGVTRIACHRGVALTCSGTAIPVVSTEGDRVIFAVADYGRGRIAVNGSAEMFAVPHIGEEDNAAFFLSTLAWLAGHPAQEGSESHGIARVERVRRLLRADSYSPLRTAPADNAASVSMATTYQHRTELKRLYQPTLDPYRDGEEFLTHAELAYHQLPQYIRREVSSFRNHSNEHGALLIRGLPPDPFVPPTPDAASYRPVRNTYMSEFWLAVFSSALGDQVGYAQESSGSLFQNVLPTKLNAAHLSSESSLVPLGLHTEIAFHPAMPDYVILYCLRQAPNDDASTFVAGVRGMLKALPLGDRASLFRRAYRTGIDFSYGSPNGHMGNGPLVSVLHGDPFDPFLRLDPDLMVGEDYEARGALTEIALASQSCTLAVNLEVADLLIIDNRRAVHGRSAFTALYDGSDRWLQRSFVLRDLDRFAARRGSSRVIHTMFAV